MLQTLSDTFTPLLWGGVLALLLNLPLRAVEGQLVQCKPRTRRVLGLILVLFGLSAVLFLVLWLLLPQLIEAFTNISFVLPSLYQTVQDFLVKQSIHLGIDQTMLSGTVFSTARIEAAGENMVSELVNVGMAAASYTAQQLARFVVALVLAVYLLASKENLAHKASLLLCAVFGQVRSTQLVALGRRADKVFASFLIGQCLEACILAALFVLALFLADIPYVLPIASLIGVTAFIPVFGSVVGGLFGFLLVAAASPSKGFWFLLIFVVVQQFENNVIYPRVVGGRVGLPPLWVMMAVVLGGGLFGLVGMFLGIPIMSVLYHIGGEWVHARVNAQKTNKGKV